jgi:hypothetical protein
MTRLVRAKACDGSRLRAIKDQDGLQMASSSCVANQRGHEK